MMSNVIHVTTAIALPRVAERVNTIMRDAKLSRFLSKHQPKVYEALIDFQEIKSYPYMCALRFAIGIYSPRVGDKFKPDTIDSLCEDIDAVRAREDFLRDKGVK